MMEKDNPPPYPGEAPTYQGQPTNQVKPHSSMASKPINIRWIRTGSQLYLNNHVYHGITDYFPQLF